MIGGKGVPDFYPHFKVDWESSEVQGDGQSSPDSWVSPTKSQPLTEDKQEQRGKGGGELAEGKNQVGAWCEIADVEAEQLGIDYGIHGSDRGFRGCVCVCRQWSVHCRSYWDTNKITTTIVTMVMKGP